MVRIVLFVVLGWTAAVQAQFIVNIPGVPAMPPRPSPPVVAPVVPVPAYSIPGVVPWWYGATITTPWGFGSMFGYPLSPNLYTQPPVVILGSGSTSPSLSNGSVTSLTQPLTLPAAPMKQLVSLPPPEPVATANASERKAQLSLNLPAGTLVEWQGKKYEGGAHPINFESGVLAADGKFTFEFVIAHRGSASAEPTRRSVTISAGESKSITIFR